MKHLEIVLLAGISTNAVINGAASHCSAQAPSEKATEASFKTQQSPLGQVSLDELTQRLHHSFAAIGEARNDKGYVHDKSVLKAHETDLRTFRAALRHRLALASDHGTGRTNLMGSGVKDRKRHLALALRRVADSFNAFEQANDEAEDPNIVVAMTVNQAYAAEGLALKELDDAETGAQL